jgi:hypothetical protein
MGLSLLFQGRARSALVKPVLGLFNGDFHGKKYRNNIDILLRSLKKGIAPTENLSGWDGPTPATEPAKCMSDVILRATACLRDEDMDLRGEDRDGGTDGRGYGNDARRTEGSAEEAENLCKYSASADAESDAIKS